MSSRLLKGIEAEESAQSSPTDTEAGVSLEA